MTPRIIAILLGIGVVAGLALYAALQKRYVSCREANRRDEC